MTVSWRTPASVALVLAALGTLAVTLPVDPASVDVRALGGVAAATTLLVATSGHVVRAALWFAGTESPEEDVDTGRAVGKVENVLVLTLVLLGAYTALGLVFTAKSIVRWQDMSSGNTTYYLTGSVTNFTYSLLVGVATAAAFGHPL